MSTINEKSVTTAPATAAELTAASLSNFCDNDTVSEKIIDYVEAGFLEIVNAIRTHYENAITSGKSVPSTVEFRLHIHDFTKLTVAAGIKDSEQHCLSVYDKIEEHEVFRARYREQLIAKLKSFGFKEWDENKCILILSLTPRLDCKL